MKKHRLAMDKFLLKSKMYRDENEKARCHRHWIQCYETPN